MLRSLSTEAYQPKQFAEILSAAVPQSTPRTFRLREGPSHAGRAPSKGVVSSRTPADPDSSE
jgi:hypothetical protein